MIEAHLELVREILPEALAWHRDPPRPPLSGDELAAEIGMRPGPEMGGILEELRAASFAGEIDGRDEALALARVAWPRTPETSAVRNPSLPRRRFPGYSCNQKLGKGTHAKDHYRQRRVRAGGRPDGRAERDRQEGAEAGLRHA